MKRALLILFITIFVTISTCFASDDGAGLRDYDGIALPKGSFIPVISAQEISTANLDIGSKVKFVTTNDLYLYETNIIPQNTEFYGFIEKLNEPIVGTNASLVIKVTKLKLTDGFEIPVRGYIYVNGNTLIGGELTPPASYDKKAAYRQGYTPLVGYVPGATRQMGEHKVIASGADLMIVLISPLYVTHTLNN